MRTDKALYEGLARAIGRRSLPAHLSGCVAESTFAAAQDSGFSQARPFPHVVIDDFLSAEFCQKLLGEFPPFSPKFAVDENGAIGGKASHRDVCSIGPNYQKLDELIQNRVFLDLISEITGIPNLLYDPDYLGGGTHENMDGQSLDFHVDFNYHHVYRWHRRINLILFLNEQWQDDWGGMLELRETPDKPGDVRVAPTFNKAVIFETNEVSWHGFSKVSLPVGSSLSRKSIALYFYTKDRPAEETAPPRSTVYVEEYLPEHLVEGHKLSADDVALMRSLLDRRDLHIARLYQHERDLIAQVFDLKGKTIKGTAERLNRFAGQLAAKIRGPGNKDSVYQTFSADLPFVRFSQTDVRPQLLQGWGDTEKTMVWSVGPSSLLEIPLQTCADLKLHIECRPFAVPDAPPQTVNVFLNDARQGSVTLEPDKKSYVISLAESDQLEGSNKLRFEYAYTKSPRDVGINNDDRQLAVAWFNLWLSE